METSDNIGAEAVTSLRNMDKLCPDQRTQRRVTWWELDAIRFFYWDRSMVVLTSGGIWDSVKMCQIILLLSIVKWTLYFEKHHHPLMLGWTFWWTALRSITMRQACAQNPPISAGSWCETEWSIHLDPGCSHESRGLDMERAPGHLGMAPSQTHRIGLNFTI